MPAALFYAASAAVALVRGVLVLVTVLVLVLVGVLVLIAVLVVHVGHLLLYFPD